MQDILYKDENTIFSLRVGGLLYRDGKVLLQHPLDDDFAVIGGHVALTETTEEALKREFREELHVEINVKDLMAIGEIYFPWANKPCHQIAFYYRVELEKESTLGDEEICGYDELDHKRVDLLYKWVPLSSLREGLKVYPLSLIPYIISPPSGTVHFIDK